MTRIAGTLQRWFVQRLITEQQVSDHTVAAYRDAIRLLVGYVHDHHGRIPAELDFADLDATIIGAFLTWLETDRHASISTRNARRSAIRSFFTYASFHHPEHAQLIARVLAIPSKRAPAPLVTFLTPPRSTPSPSPQTQQHGPGVEIDACSPLRSKPGLRVSELVALQRDDLTFGVGGHLRCIGKGRKDRAVPVTAHTQRMLTGWLAEHTHGPVFARSYIHPLTRDAFRRIIDRHTITAAQTCPTLTTKNITPHVLRHYVDGWVMWPVGVLGLVTVLGAPVPAT